MWLTEFFNVFKYYLVEIIPALLIGFFLSGLVHEFIPEHWVNKHLGGKGIKGILYSTLIGTLVPVCCWGSLPIAVSFYMRGASLGCVLAILIATPATSINALIVAAKFLGLKFAIYLFFSVIFMGISIGIIGNMIKIKPKAKPKAECECPTCEITAGKKPAPENTFQKRIKSVLKFAYIRMPKEIGVETLIGLVLAALVSVVAPIGFLVKNYLVGNIGYLFSTIFGVLTYMCATMSVPLVDAFIKQGLSIGPALSLLLIGPITSYGTILVLRKEFGAKLLVFYIASICILAVVLGHIFSLI